jgi:hypothetical protein
MRTLFALAVPLALLAGPARAADDAAALIDKAIKARGGADAIAKEKAAQWHSKGVVHIMGMKIEYEADYSFQAPGQIRFDLNFEVMNQKINLTAATDGKVCWEKMGDKANEMDKKKAEAFRDNVYGMYVSMALPVKGKEYTLSVTGEEKVEGKPAVGVLVSRKGKPDVTLFFDKESGLLAKAQMQIWDEFTDQTVSQETIYLTYKDKTAEKILIKRDGKTFLEEEMSNWKAFDKLDEKMFEKP